MLTESGPEEWDIDKSYLAELITAYQRTYSSSYQILVNDASDSVMTAEALLYVEAAGIDEKMAGQLADSLQALLKEYHTKAADKAGSHKLTLLGRQNTAVADTGLQTQQHDKRAQLASYRANLKTITDAFSKEQLAVFHKEAAVTDDQIEMYGSSRAAEESGTEEEDLKEGAAEDDFHMIIKYVLFGFIGGLFAYCCIFACWYLFGDTLKGGEEMKEIYTFPFYGSIPCRTKADKRKGKHNGTVQDADGQSGAQLLNRIRLACRRQGITKLCAASDYLFDMREKECMEHLAEQLEGYGIHAVIAEHASADTALWDMLVETGNVLMVCRIGTTTHRMIDDAMRFYGENGITVMGAIAFK